ncbi:dihydrodipicolinate synthase family protein [Cohnella zeiphila]|uniref:Dihydrodipicolinate synthase family protein n=1 Tax=Cohnella zeiphila TaxID=2761120 RepID=A0A7X0VZG9_9BACL|nr:dihydrodipicolinate synthase family protein [Cohnella zeiphila]MBB6735715.1 dihydrodipicolinate synthase family protein [Cohnella zeiphila]
MIDRFKQAVAGINAIPVTPFDERGGIDYEAFGETLDFLIRSGMETVYPCGNTGEFYALTLDEAKAVVSFAVRHAAGRAKVVAGIGYDERTAAELARHAEAEGADGVMVHQPVHPFMTDRGLVAYYRSVARSVSLPLVLYVRSESATAEALREAAAEPNIAAVKYAVNDLPAFAKAVRLIGDRFAWICGTAEKWAPFFFAAGAVGFTSGLVNVDGGRSVRMLEALREGRFGDAMAIWEDVRPFEELREARRSGNNVSVVKEAMAQLGRSNGVVRPPIAPLLAEEKAQVRDILRRWGLLA